MRISRILLIALSLSALAGCGVFDRLTGRAAPVAAAPATGAGAPSRPASRPVLGQGQSAARLDTTTEAERQAALARPKTAGARELGKVVVSLGPPSEGGLWLKAPVVPMASRGRVLTATGQSLAVDLEPGEGGAILSFGAFRALGLPLTGLPEVTVFVE